MELSKDDMLIILQKYDDRYRDDLNKTLLFINKIFSTYHREKQLQELKCLNQNQKKHQKHMP